MFEELVKEFVFVFEAYAVAGFVFAAVFVSSGVQTLDSEARGSGVAFRLLIAPGVAAFWPMLLVSFAHKREHTGPSSIVGAGARK